MAAQSAICAQRNPQRCRGDAGSVDDATWGKCAPARRGRVKGVRRVNLTRVRYYIYYRVSASFLDVLAFWHTSRAGHPRV
jgi:hypothetical protein